MTEMTEFAATVTPSSPEVPPAASSRLRWAA